MGKGMGKGDWTEAAKQILDSDPGLDEAWISDTVSTREDGQATGYHVVRREGKDPKLTKYHD